VHTKWTGCPADNSRDASNHAAPRDLILRLRLLRPRHVPACHDETRSFLTLSSISFSFSGQFFLGRVCVFLFCYVFFSFFLCLCRQSRIEKGGLRFTPWVAGGRGASRASGLQKRESTTLCCGKSCNRCHLPAGGPRGFYLRSVNAGFVENPLHGPATMTRRRMFIGDLEKSSFSRCGNDSLFVWRVACWRIMELLTAISFAAANPRSIRSCTNSPPHRKRLRFRVTGKRYQGLMRTLTCSRIAGWTTAVQTCSISEESQRKKLWRWITRGRHEKFR